MVQILNKVNMVIKDCNNNKKIKLLLQIKIRLIFKVKMLTNKIKIIKIMVHQSEKVLFHLQILANFY